MGPAYKIIDWDKVDDGIMCGYSGIEIAAVLNISKETLYDASVREKGVPYSTYASNMFSKGDALLKRAQFMKAVGATKKGDTTLLLHLGKFRLGQIDVKTESDIPNEEFLKLQAEHMKILHELEELKKEKMDALQPKTTEELQRIDETL